MNKWIPQPFSGLLCFLTALCTGLLFIIIILIVTITRQGVNHMEQTMEVKLRNLSLGVQTSVEKLSQEDSRMMKKLTDFESFIKDMRAASVISKIKGMEASVNRILSDDVIGSITSDIQGVLGAVGRLRDEIRKENITRDPLCDIGWKHHSYSCYFYSQRAKTWEGAKKDCEKRNAHLVVINGEEENIFLQDVSLTLWIGLTDVDGSWKWVDGTSYDASPKFWGQDQPDEWFGHGLGGGEDCGQLFKTEGWNDDHCSRSFNYVCEKKML
ncbi:asialoglycoprotein receptor 1-like [Mantella aurantiaca]